MSGLSSATFMGGLMQGANFVEGMQNRSHARGLADEAFSMKKETHDQQKKLNGFKIEEAETKLLLSDLDRDLRSMEETGETFSQEQWDKYKPIGFDKFQNKNWREENKDAGALLHRGMTTGQWDEGALDAFNTTFYDELRGREKEDGLKRKIIGVKETEDGRSVAILEITGKDGKKYNAPLTKGGTADDEDSLVLFDDEKLDEIYKVQMHRADMAYAIDKADGDPKKLAAVLRRIAFKSDKSEYTIKDVRDESGQSRMARFDKNKNFVNWVGGAEPFKDSKGRLVGRGRGVGLSESVQTIDWKEYRKLKNDALKTGDPDAIQGVDAIFESTNGFTVDDFNTVRKQFESKEIYRDPTVEEVRAAIKGRNQAQIERRTENAIAENPNQFGVGLVSANQTNEYGQRVITTPDQQTDEINNFAKASGDAPEDLADIVAQNAQVTQDSKAPGMPGLKDQLNAAIGRNPNKNPVSFTGGVLSNFMASDLGVKALKFLSPEPSEGLPPEQAQFVELKNQAKQQLLEEVKQEPPLQTRRGAKPTSKGITLNKAMDALNVATTMEEVNAAIAGLKLSNAALKQPVADSSL